jgi:hypothetical protein
MVVEIAEIDPIADEGFHKHSEGAVALGLENFAKIRGGDQHNLTHGALQTAGRPAVFGLQGRPPPVEARLCAELGKHTLKVLDGEHIRRKQIMRQNIVELRRRAHNEGQRNVSGKGFNRIRELMVAIKLAQSVGCGAVETFEIGTQLHERRRCCCAACFYVVTGSHERTHHRKQLRAALDGDRAVLRLQTPGRPLTCGGTRECQHQQKADWHNSHSAEESLPARLCRETRDACPPNRQALGIGRTACPDEITQTQTLTACSRRVKKTWTV